MFHGYEFGRVVHHPPETQIIQVTPERPKSYPANKITRRIRKTED